jgi:hypothetical protein
MYLLGNAFRINQTRAPDNLPTVHAAKVFFTKVNAMEKRISKNDKSAIQYYADSLDILGFRSEDEGERCLRVHVLKS